MPDPAVAMYSVPCWGDAMKNLRSHIVKAISLLESSAEIQTIYPLLREIGDMLLPLYKRHPGPQIHLRGDGWGFWRLETLVPDVDYRHIADWSENDPLSPEDDTEIRRHLISILKMWLVQDDLFTPPMDMATVAKSLDIEVKTLNRRIDNGTISGFKVNKNLVRILKTDLPLK